MRSYLNLLQHVLNHGEQRANRTGVVTRSITGAHLRYDLRDGFPAVTTKRLAFGQVQGELVGFLRAYTSAASFRDVGCRIWDANANEERHWLSNPHRRGVDDLGRIYGVQWRNWQHHDVTIDQLRLLLLTLLSDPTSRRMVVTAWNPGELNQCALPPCHLLWQVTVDPATQHLDLCFYMRSVDLFLGLPFNIASYALLAHLIAYTTGYTARHLNAFLADAHIYETHMQQAREQLAREPRQLPALFLHTDSITRELTGSRYHNAVADPLRWMLHVYDVCAPRPHCLLGAYNPHPAIAAPMAV